jgi:hypothetical protein
MDEAADQKLRYGFYGGLLLTVVVGLYLAWLWQPERQVRLHAEHLIAKFEDRKSSGVADFISESYRDDWGHDRARLLERTQIVLQVLKEIHIVTREAQTTISGNEARWMAKVSIRAEGEFAPLVVDRVNAIETPFELVWRQHSWKPWDWKLVRVSNPDLQIPEDF